MAVEGLPEGLVSNKEGVVPVVESEDRVEAEQVAYLWRGKTSQKVPFYTAKKTVLAENIGRRLDNFFWRIWSNQRLRQRLSGTQVNILFEIINQGGFIRTTPTSSPRSSKSLKAYYKEARLRTPPTTPPNAEIPKESTSSTKAGPSKHSELDSDTSTSTLARSFAHIERKKHPGPLTSHGNVDDGSVTPKPTSPLTTIEKSRSAIGHSPSSRYSEESSVTPTPTSPLDALEKPSESSKENRRISPSTTRRPPILKKESSGSSRSSKSAKVLDPLPGETSAENEKAVSVDDEANLATSTKSSLARRPTTTRFNEEVAVSIPRSLTSASRSHGDRAARPGAENSQRPGKRNPTVVANTGASKTRPTFVRQRSSIGASKEVPSRSSSSQNLARSPKSPSAPMPTGSLTGSKSKHSPEPPSTSRARAVSPHPSKQRRRQSPDLESSEERSEESDLEESETTTKSKFCEDFSKSPAGKQPEASKPLVDPDFRAKFIDRTRTPQRSLTDLSAFARKSSAAVPTAASFQASGTMEAVQATSIAGRGKGREAFTNVTAPLKAPGPTGPEAAGDEHSQPLPRTKSQLTLLLEKERVRSANEERKARRT